MDFSLDPSRRQALAEAAELPVAIKTIDRLAAVHGLAASSWAVGQLGLRQKATGKFSLASRMIFTTDGLEMTSHEKVSEFHASLFQRSEAVLDACCGIGGDLIALARNGAALGCDLSQEALQCAHWNLRMQDLSAELQQGSCLDLDWEGRSVWMDPARRDGGKRLLNPDSFSPSLSAILQKAKEAQRVWIKLTPLLSDSILESEGKGLIFVSHGGECVEALMQAGSSPDERSRRAILLEKGLSLESSQAPTQAEGPGNWVYEADPAAIRGHCLGGFGLESLSDTPGWLTGGHKLTSPWLTGFQVLWSGPWRESAVASVLSGEKAWLDAVKTRGVALDPSGLLKRLRKRLAKGDGPRLELLLYSRGPKVRALLAERLRAPSVD